MQLHAHEQDRLESLRSYRVLDTAPEPAYDALTRLAALVCSTPVALISLVDADRQWFKSAYGSKIEQTPRDVAFCSDVVASEETLVVIDALSHPDYADNALVSRTPGIRAYAGVPLIGRDGLPLGTLCVVDWEPRSFTDEQREGLELLAGQVVAQLELRRLDHLHGRSCGGVLAEVSDPVRLRRALEAGELQPHFQPVVYLPNRRTVGFEALLRWEHPQHGVLPPSVFLPAIESSGLIWPVGRHMLERSLAALAGFEADPTLPNGLVMAVNVSGAQLQKGLADVVLDAVSGHRLAPRQVTVEITETAPIEDLVVAQRELATLRDAGVQLALDDYGVGFSSLSRLLELPMTALKLDRSLVSGVADDESSVAVARSTFALAKTMSLDVVCEGIETEPQRAVLLAMGAQYAQGWLFGRPMDQLAATRHLRNQREHQTVPAPREATATETLDPSLEAGAQLSRPQQW